MRFLVLLSLVLTLPIYAKSPVKPFGTLQDSQSFRDYTLRIYLNEQAPPENDTDPDHRNGVGCFEILRSGKQVYFQRGIKFKVEHVAYEASTNIGPAIMGQCVIGDKQPNLVVSEVSGGNNFCENLYLFQIGDSCKLIKTIKTTGGGEFQDLRGDGSLSLVTYERTLEGLCSCEADAVYAKIIYQYSDHNYRIDLAAMKKPAPNQLELLKKAKDIGAAFTGAYSGGKWTAPTELKGRMLDLIYSGNMATAWKLCDLSWSAKRPGKAQFLKEFVQQLKSSPHYNDINQARFQNGAGQKH